MSDLYPFLEDNHTTRVTDDGLLHVRCPYVDAETTWSAEAEPEEIECEFCVALHKIEDPDLPGHAEHDCEDPDEDES